MRTSRPSASSSLSNCPRSPCGLCAPAHPREHASPPQSRSPRRPPGSSDVRSRWQGSRASGPSPARGCESPRGSGGGCASPPWPRPEPPPAPRSARSRSSIRTWRCVMKREGRRVVRSANRPRNVVAEAGRLRPALLALRPRAADAAEGSPRQPFELGVLPHALVDRLLVDRARVALPPDRGPIRQNFPGEANRGVLGSSNRTMGCHDLPPARVAHREPCAPILGAETQFADFLLKALAHHADGLGRAEILPPCWRRARSR